MLISRLSVHTSGTFSEAGCGWISPAVACCGNCAQKMYLMAYVSLHMPNVTRRPTLRYLWTCCRVEKLARHKSTRVNANIHTYGRLLYSGKRMYLVILSCFRNCQHRIIPRIHYISYDLSTNMSCSAMQPHVLIFSTSSSGTLHPLGVDSASRLTVAVRAGIDSYSLTAIGCRGATTGESMDAVPPVRRLHLKYTSRPHMVDLRPTVEPHWSRNCVARILRSTTLLLHISILRSALLYLPGRISTRSF